MPVARYLIPSQSVQSRAFDEAIHALLANRPRHKREANLVADLHAVFRAMDVGTIEREYPVGGGSADIYLPNKRTFVEVKGLGGAINPDEIRGGGRPVSPPAAGPICPRRTAGGAWKARS